MQSAIWTGGGGEGVEPLLLFQPHAHVISNPPPLHRAGGSYS